MFGIPTNGDQTTWRVSRPPPLSRYCANHTATQVMRYAQLYLYCHTAKVKITPWQVRSIQRYLRVRGQGVPRPPYPRYALSKRLGGPSGWSGRVGEEIISCPHRGSNPGPSSPKRVATAPAPARVHMREGIDPVPTGLARPAGGIRINIQQQLNTDILQLQTVPLAQRESENE